MCHGYLHVQFEVHGYLHVQFDYPMGDIHWFLNLHLFSGFFNMLLLPY